MLRFSSGVSRARRTFGLGMTMEWSYDGMIRVLLSIKNTILEGPAHSFVAQKPDEWGIVDGMTHNQELRPNMA